MLRDVVRDILLHPFEPPMNRPDGLEQITPHHRLQHVSGGTRLERSTRQDIAPQRSSEQ